MDETKTTRALHRGSILCSVPWRILWTGLVCLLSHMFAGPAWAVTEIWLRDATTQAANITMKIGEIRTIEVMASTGGLQFNGVSFYLSWPQGMFELIDAEPAVTGLQPFKVQGGVFGDLKHNVADNETIDDQERRILDGDVALAAGRFLSGSGRVATFQIRAVQRTAGTQITIDRYFTPRIRDTRYQLFNNGSSKFDVQRNLGVIAVGIGLEGIPNVAMLPGQINSGTNLMDYVVNFTGDTTSLGWQALGGSPSTVSVSIGPPPRFPVTYTAAPGFTGRRDIVFSVTDLSNVTDIDSVLVSVTQPPVIQGWPDPRITFPEDGFFETAPLQLLVDDPDGNEANVTWKVTPFDTVLTVQYFPTVNRYRISGPPNWFGTDTLKVVATDELGATDTLIIPVLVTSVNDAPIISPPIPDIGITPGGVNSDLRLNDYARDVEAHSLRWDVIMSGPQVTVSLEPGAGYRATFSATPGFEGSLFAYLTVTDGPGLTTRDTIRVSVAALPPRFRTGGLPDTLLCSSKSTTQDYVDLDNYVLDADDPISALTWSVSQAGGGAQLVIGSDNLVKVLISGANYRGYQTNVFTVRDPDGNTTVDTVRFIFATQGSPTVIDIPDISVPVGGVNTDLVLSNYVFNCNPGDAVTWDASGYTNLTVTIDPTTTRVTVRASAGFIGSDRIDFRATRNDTKITGADRVNVNVYENDTPFIIPDLPDVFLTPKSDQTLDLSRYLVIRPDSLRSVVQWSVAGDQSKVRVQINQVTQIATFTLLDAGFLGTQNFTFTVRNPRNNRSDTDDITVHVNNGKAPVLGRIPDFVISSGSTDSLRNGKTLDNYVLDDDTPDNTLAFTVTGHSFVTITGARLASGADHQLVIGAFPTFQGTETLLLTVQDPEGNTDTDTFTVTVTKETAFDVVVLPNPISRDYIDVVVYSASSLAQGPFTNFTLAGALHEVSMTPIGAAGLWRGNVLFNKTLGTGTAKITTTALDHFNRTLIDTTSFLVGAAGAGQTTTLAKGGVLLTIPPDALPAGQTVLLFEQGASLAKTAMADAADDALETIATFDIIAGAATLKQPVVLDVDLSTYTTDLTDRTDHYGLFRTFGTEQRLVERFDANGRLNAAITELGSFVIARDDLAPVVESADAAVEAAELALRLVVEEWGSGISWTSAVILINNEPIPAALIRDDGSLVWPLESLRLEPGVVQITVQVPDQLGNLSNIAVATLLLEESQIPRRYVLEPNFPNPFNPQTRLRYQLAEPSRATLAIYNLLGQRVRTLVDDALPAGWHEAVWDGMNDAAIRVASGVYLYRLDAGTFHEVRKMILVK